MKYLIIRGEGATPRLSADNLHSSTNLPVFLNQDAPSGSGGILLYDCGGDYPTSSDIKVYVLGSCNIGSVPAIELTGDDQFQQLIDAITLSGEYEGEE